MIRNTRQMKWCVVLAALAAGLQGTCFAAPLSIVEHGASDYLIYASPASAAPEVYAAELLQDYVARMSGCTLPIVREMPEGKKIIYVGFADVPASLLAMWTPRPLAPKNMSYSKQATCCSLPAGSPGARCMA